MEWASRNVFLGNQRVPEICHEGDGSSRCAQQRYLCQKNKECPISLSMCVYVQLSRKHNEDEDSSNKLYTLVTYVLIVR